MDKSMKWKIAAAAAILLGILFAAVAIYLIPRLYDLSVEAAFSYDASVSDLPLTGYAPPPRKITRKKPSLFSST